MKKNIFILFLFVFFLKACARGKKENIYIPVHKNADYSSHVLSNYLRPKAKCDWQIVYTTEFHEFYGIWEQGPDNLYLTGGNNIWYRASNRDPHIIWSKNSVFLKDLWGSTSGDIYAVGYNFRKKHGLIVHCLGDNCEEIETTTDGEINSIWGFSPGSIYAVGFEGDSNPPKSVILKYDGISWEKIPINKKTRLTGIWGTSPTNLYVIGWENNSLDRYEGRIFHWNGKVLKEMPIECPMRLLKIWGSSDKEIFVVGNDHTRSITNNGPAGVILHFDGKIWSHVLLDNKACFYALWGWSKNEVYVGGSKWETLGTANRGVIYRYNDSVWQEMKSCAKYPIEDFCGGIKNTVYAIQREGVLMQLTK
ncbi:MAG: hypothetical protein ACMUIU_03395 [bacterium]